MEIVNGCDSRLDRAYARAQGYVDNVQERAPEIAENVAGNLAKIALFAFIGLLLGAVAAAFEGRTGRQLDEAVAGEPAVVGESVR